MKNLCRHLRFTVLFALLLAAFFLPAATGMAAGQSITTLFASNNLAAGNMFNVTVLASVDIRIDSFDINLHEAAEASLVSAYYRPGGYEGYESDANAWTFAGSADVISQGQDNPTPLPVGNIRLTAGKTYGFYITISNYTPESTYMWYTNNNSTYADSNLQITCGVGKGDPDFFGSTYPMRTWNGTIYYSLIPTIPETGDPAGRLVWLYVPLGMLSCCGLILLGKRVVRRAAP